MDAKKTIEMHKMCEELMTKRIGIRYIGPNYNKTIEAQVKPYLPKGRVVPNRELTFDSINQDIAEDRKRAIRVYQFQKRIQDDVKIRSRQSFEKFIDQANNPSGISGIGEDYWNFLENKAERQVRMRSEMEFKRERVLEKFALLREFSPKSKKFGFKTNSGATSRPALRTLLNETSDSMRVTDYNTSTIDEPK